MDGSQRKLALIDNLPLRAVASVHKLEPRTKIGGTMRDGYSTVQRIAHAGVGPSVAESLRNTNVGEVLGKASLLAAFGVFATFKAIAVKSQFMSWEPAQGIESHIALAAQIASLVFLVLLLSLTLLRFKPKETAKGSEPRISALIGTLLSLSLVALPMQDLGPVLRATAICLILVGWLLSIYVLVWLGRSFSIMAQARRLVTRGPYSVVRHPLYVSEEIAMIGMVLLCLSPLATLIAAVQWMFQLRRMTHEERVLRESFPEYSDYAALTPKIIPRQFLLRKKRVPTASRPLHEGVARYS